METKHFNKLTEAEAERIAILMEECAEVIQICGKILRHGYESYNPFDMSKTTNRQLLQKEIGDVEYITHSMKSNLDIDYTMVSNQFNLKKESIKSFLHHQNKGK